MRPSRHRNQSDFPEGDRDPARECDRLNSTNYRYYMGNVSARVPHVIYASKCSASIQIPHIQTVLTKRIDVAALGHKMRQFINCFLQSYMLLIFLFTKVSLTISFSTFLEAL